MLFNLKYGRNKISLPAENILAVVEPKELPGLLDPADEVSRFLRQPIGAKPLRQLVQERKPQKVAAKIGRASCRERV